MRYNKLNFRFYFYFLFEFFDAVGNIAFAKINKKALLKLYFLTYKQGFSGQMDYKRLLSFAGK